MANVPRDKSSTPNKRNAGNLGVAEIN